MGLVLYFIVGILVSPIILIFLVVTAIAEKLNPSENKTKTEYGGAIISYLIGTYLFVAFVMGVIS
jgi:hypothetical protein